MIVPLWAQKITHNNSEWALNILLEKGQEVYQNYIYYPVIGKILIQGNCVI